MMTIILISFFIALIMVVRSGILEYKFYKSVKIYEPVIWNEMGAPNFLFAMWAFLGFEKSTLFERVSNEIVLDLARKNKSAQIQAVSFFVLILATSIVLFNVA